MRAFLIIFLFFSLVYIALKYNNQQMISSLKSVEKISHDSHIELPPIPKIVNRKFDLSILENDDSHHETKFDKLSENQKKRIHFQVLNELFLVTRGMKPKDQDLLIWLNVLNQNGSREGVYHALVLDEVYAELEQLDEKRSDKMMDMVLEFYHIFANEKISQSFLKNFNSYSLKRKLTERFLSVMDSFEKKDDFDKWYAVLSFKMAKEYGKFFLKKRRKTVSKNYHYKWSQESTRDFVKLETILKLHIIMNKLKTL